MLINRCIKNIDGKNVNHVFEIVKSVYKQVFMKMQKIKTNKKEKRKAKKNEERNKKPKKTQ